MDTLTLDSTPSCWRHYNDQGHQVIASQILPQIAPILGWCQGADAFCREKVGAESYCKYWQASGVCEGTAVPCHC